VSSALRSFLYLDATLVAEFLSQLEGGVYSEEESRARTRSGKDIGGEAGAGIGPAKLGFKAGRASGQEDETARTIQQTPESAFARLFAWLEESGDLRYVEAFDDDGWESQRRSEILEAGVTVSVSTLAKLASLAEQVGPLLQLVETFGGETVDAKAAEAIQGFRLLGGVTDKVPVVARLVGSPKYKFIAPLSRQHLRVDPGEVDGEATMLLKLQRKLQRGDKYTLLDSIAGLSALPRAKRREMERSMKNDKDFPDAVIGPPAAVVTPIAIYR